MGSQPMRTTQLIFNHGPGAILETVDGPAIVREFSSLMETDLLKEKGFPDRFEIFSPRLSEQLVPKNGQKVRLHWLPSNAELGKGDEFYSIRTNVFPGWMLCNKAKLHNGDYAVLFRHGFVPAITRLVLNVMRLPQQFVLLNIVMMGTLMILVGDTMFAE